MDTTLTTNRYRGNLTSSPPSFLNVFSVMSVEDNSDCRIYILKKGEELFTMKVALKDGKQEGPAAVVREDGSVYKELSFSGSEPFGEWRGFDGSGHLVASGVFDGITKEYNEDGSIKWMGKYKMGMRYSELKPSTTCYGYYEERSLKGDLLSIAQYDKDVTRQSGICYYFFDNRLVSEYLTLNEKSQIVRSFAGETMTEFDGNGKIVFMGKYRGSIQNGFVADWEEGNSVISLTKGIHTAQFIKEQSTVKNQYQRRWKIWLWAIVSCLLLYEIGFTIKMSVLTDSDVSISCYEEYRHLMQWKLDRLHSLYFDYTFGYFIEDCDITIHSKSLKELNIGTRVRV